MEKIICMSISLSDVSRYEEIEKVESAENIQKTFDTLLSPEVMNGSKISNVLFPIDNVDIFISYSHNDEGIAKRLASYLTQDKGLKVFLDYQVWKSSDSFLRKLNGHKCLTNKGELSYDKVLLTSSYVHSILSGALFEQIRKSTIMIIVNTKNSIPKFNDDYFRTLSPWIYQEATFANGLVEHNRSIRESARFFADSNKINMTFDLPINNAEHMTFDSFKRALSCKRGIDAIKVMKEL